MWSSFASLARSTFLAALLLLLGACVSAPPPPTITPNVTAVAPTTAPIAVPPTAAPATLIPVEPQPDEPQRISFAPGATEATIEGAVVRGTTNRYILRAEAGQQINVSISSLERNAVFNLSTPGGQPLQGAGPMDDATAWAGRLPESGDYLLEVGATRGNAGYTLTVQITTPTSSTGDIRTTDWEAAIVLLFNRSAL